MLAEEAALLDLEETDLVALSACESGLGLALDGEGVFGLRRAFVEAGAHNLLVSLWSVSDEATRILMERFYHHYFEGHDAVTALTLAQREFLARDHTNDLFSVLWAPFIASTTVLGKPQGNSQPTRQQQAETTPHNMDTSEQHAASSKQNNGQSTLAASNELFRLDPGKSEAGQLREKIAQDYGQSPEAAAKANPWTNSLGMVFVPVPTTKVLFCIWETRVQDYQAFLNSSGKTRRGTPADKGSNHPVLACWEEAQEFCQWLSKKEGFQYRLPTDAEWSAAVGLGYESGSTPAEKDMKIEGEYPWGNQWPPPRTAGNYGSRRIADHNGTAPVGSFDANQYGLFDMGGNVWEWCEDWFDNNQKFRVLRGASWGCNEPGLLLSSCRKYYTPSVRNDDFGFRVVLSRRESK